MADLYMGIVRLREIVVDVNTLVMNGNQPDGSIEPPGHLFDVCATQLIMLATAHWFWTLRPFVRRTQ